MPLSRDLAQRAHDALALRVLQPLYHTSLLARPNTRASERAFRDGLRFRVRTRSWSEDKKRQWILQRLRFSVRRAAQETSHYRDLFGQVGFDPRDDFDFGDFARLPVLERSAVRAAGKNLVSLAVPASRLRKDATGGSTGEPTELWLGPEERGWRASGMEHFMRRLAMPAGTRTALLWGHHLDPLERSGLVERVQDWIANVRWYDSLRLSPEILAAYHGEFERTRPHCILAYAGALAQLAEHVNGKDTEPPYPTRCFVTGAEKLLPHQRRAIEDVYRRPVHERYGSRDVGMIGFQVDIPLSLNFDIDWATFLVEPESMDDYSSILVTKLHADGMPMLRYRIGDIGRFPQGSEPGSPTFVLHEVVGRETERIWLPDGQWVHGLAFPHLMKDFPVREFQVVQRADCSVQVRVIPAGGFDEQVRRRLLDIVAANLRGLTIELIIVTEIPRTRANKWRPVISEVPQAGPVRP